MGVCCDQADLPQLWSFHRLTMRIKDIQDWQLLHRGLLIVLEECGRP